MYFGRISLDLVYRKLQLRYVTIDKTDSEFGLNIDYGLRLRF